MIIIRDSFNFKIKKVVTFFVKKIRDMAYNPVLSNWKFWMFYYTSIMYFLLPLKLATIWQLTVLSILSILRYILKGFGRMYDFMPEIAIDVPAAYNILERFVTRCRQAGLITDELVRKMPTRGRKRFVSEGDGGLVKANFW